MRVLRHLILLLLIALPVGTLASPPITLALKFPAKVEPSSGLASGRTLDLIHGLEGKQTEVQVETLRHELARSSVSEEEQAYLQANLGLALMDANENEAAYVATKSSWAWFKKSRILKLRLRLLNNLVLSSAYAGFVDESQKWLDQFGKEEKLSNPTAAFAANMNFASYCSSTRPAVTLALIQSLETIVARMPDVPPSFEKGETGRSGALYFVYFVKAAALANLWRMQEASEVLALAKGLAKQFPAGIPTLFAFFADYLDLIVSFRSDSPERVEGALKIFADQQIMGQSMVMMAVFVLAQSDFVSESNIQYVWDKYAKTDSNLGFIYTIMFLSPHVRSDPASAETFLHFLAIIEKVAASRATMSQEDRDLLKKSLPILRYPSLLVAGRYSEAAKTATDAGLVGLAREFANSHYLDESEFGTFLGKVFSGLSNPLGRIGTELSRLSSLETLTQDSQNELLVQAKRIREVGLGTAMLEKANQMIAHAKAGRDPWGSQEGYQALADAYKQLAKDRPAEAETMRKKRRDALILSMAEAEELQDVAAVATSSLELALENGIGSDLFDVRMKALNAFREPRYPE